MKPSKASSVAMPKWAFSLAVSAMALPAGIAAILAKLPPNVRDIMNELLFAYFSRTTEPAPS
jgi:hypothetical protein